MNLKVFLLIFFSLSKAIGFSIESPAELLRKTPASSILKVDYFGSIENKKLILRIEISPGSHRNLQSALGRSHLMGDEVLIIENTYLYWGYNVSLQEVDQLAKKSASFHQLIPSKFQALLKISIPNAQARTDEFCDPQPLIQSEIKSLNTKVNSLALKDFVKNCDFQIENLVAKKIQEFKDTWSKIENATLSGFLTSIKDAFRTLAEILPQINAKIIQPLQELALKVPPLANKLVCGFVEEKVGDTFIALAAGPAGLIRFTAKTAKDIAEFAHHVYKFTGNGTAASFIIDLHHRGLLRDVHLERLTDLQNDFPAEIKNKIGKRFHGFQGHENMKSHIQKHQKEMGFRSPDDYLNAAHHFAKHVDKDNLVYDLGNGRVRKWNSRTDEFLVLNKDGSIITYFKPGCGVSADSLLYLISMPEEISQSQICRKSG